MRASHWGSSPGRDRGVRLGATSDIALTRDRDVAVDVDGMHLHEHGPGRMHVQAYGRYRATHEQGGDGTATCGARFDAVSISFNGFLQVVLVLYLPDRQSYI